MERFTCPITGLSAERIDIFNYRLSFEGENYFISHGNSFKYLIEDEIFKKNRHLLAGAILNKQLDAKGIEDIYWFSLTNENFNGIFDKIIYPKSPQGKLDNLFKSLCKLQVIDGEFVDVSNLFEQPAFYYKHFFKSAAECLYYVKELQYQEYIRLSSASIASTDLQFLITFKGLNYFVEITNSGALSNRCFIAMSFDLEMKNIRDAIKSVVQENGFEPVVIDEELIDSSQTINDAIISEIKSCKFCIADFSQQKDGVYFESGFAVGLGKPVIYTCNEIWFTSSHFDTNHFPHIIYKSDKELIDKLDKKIKAWIK